MENKNETPTLETGKKTKYPTLHVKNFGKISEASVELAPLTIFAGNNDSGKSYLISLMYGLLQYNSLFLYNIFENENENENENTQFEEYQKCLNIIPSITDFPKFGGRNIKEISQNDIQCFVDLYNKLLSIDKNREMIIDFIFNSKGNLKIDDIKLEFPITAYNFRISTITKTSDGITHHNIEIHYTNTIEFYYANTIVLINFDDNNSYRLVNLILIAIVLALFEVGARKPANTKKAACAFLPTTRSGFLLTYNELAKRSVENQYQGSTREQLLNENKTIFTKPIIDFITLLLSFKDSARLSNPFSDIIDFLEKEIIQVSVAVDDVGKILYKPTGHDIEPLRMHLTSGVVSDMAPIILFLKHYKIQHNFIIEEPEISLHPELQKKITQVFIRLVNKGVRTFITTHSDTIVEHVNNMIMLNNNTLERKEELFKELGYKDEDAIDGSTVRIYQFNVDNKTQKSNVVSVPSSKYGFNLYTFHNFLSDAVHEFDMLIEQIKD